MEKQYRLWNNIIGWGIFLIATIIYFLTLQPTASWWDCGEFISTTYKLEVPHSPGNPTFQLIGRIFTLFAFGDTAKVALMMNAMSALCSSFTILFLFWTITLLAKKLIGGTKEMTRGSIISILGAGTIGALAYAFSDTFWFSAVEGEVYAMSSFFTAVVFWAMLRWEQEADKPYATRWIILNAFLIGLSIGVHLLNLLTIPALAYIYYYKKYDRHDWKGWLLTGVISVAIVGILLWLIIPWTVELAGYFDLFFVNRIGLPFNYGSFIYFILLAGLVTLGIWYTQKRGKLLWNTILLCFSFILIGYSSFFSIVIRANETLPINMNQPSDPMSMVSYLNREQYGTQPLLYGPYYSTPAYEFKDGKQQYIKSVTIDSISGKKKYKYIASGHSSSEVIYPPGGSTLFPRMWSDQSHHIEEYKSWVGEPREKVSFQTPNGERKTFSKPSFGQNLKFFFTYQIGHMYLRYFMWNFSGRQNNIEGHGEVNRGNWITGFDLLDGQRIGTQSDLPPTLQNNANNKYYLLPFILGLVGLLFSLYKNPRLTWIVFLLFFMTGLAIVIYLNQPPLQPRERDYAYAGSFYAFAIWIGFSVLALYNWLKDKADERLVAIVSSVVLLGVPVLMLAQNWDDHNRSGNYAARDYGINYLNSCPPNAILYTYGDNDTYPLWYAQEVEGVRTDVRVINYGLSYSPWYANMAMHKINQSEKLPLTLSMDYYDKGVNDFIYVANAMDVAVPLMDGIRFIQNKKNQRKIPNGDAYSWLPTGKFFIPVDKEKVIRSGLVSAEEAGLLEDSIPVNIAGNQITRKELLFMDLLATNNWERPICFTTPTPSFDLADLSPYIHLTGFSYQLLPYPAESYSVRAGGLRVDSMYTFYTEKFRNGALEKPEVTIDRQSRREIEMPLRHMTRLAQALLTKGDTARTREVLRKIPEYFPNEKFPYSAINMNFFMITLQYLSEKPDFAPPADEVGRLVYLIHYLNTHNFEYEFPEFNILGYIDMCLSVGDTELALQTTETFVHNAEQELMYYERQKSAVQRYYTRESNAIMSNLLTLSYMMKHYNQHEVSQHIDEFLQL